MIDLATLKTIASGRWPEIISTIGGIPLEAMNGKNQPCPKCGGKDRFRMINREAGALYCNQCLKKNNGDGIAAVMWLTDMTFADTIARLAADLGLTDETPNVDPVQEMAWRKGITTDSLVAFGASNTNRGELPVCRVPMHDEDMKVVGHLDLAPSPDGFDKGKMTHGSRHGLFVSEKPSPGDTVVLVEGVKDAAALHGIGIQAVGLPTCRMDAAFASFFRSINVVVTPDRDKAGLEGANETAARLFGVAETVKIAELPAEYQETGGADVRDVLLQRDGEAKVRKAIQGARAWATAGETGRELVLISLADAVHKYIENIGTKEDLFKTGLPVVDWAIGGGLLPGEVMVIAGRPSHGKTMVGMQALDALSMAFPVLMISEEMSIAALAQRTICRVSNIDSERWREDKEQLRAEMDRHLGQRKACVIAESCGTIERAVEAIAKAKEEHGIGAVAIDYLQMLRGKGSGRYEQITDVSMRIKQAAVKHGVVMLALCQLNRAVESRQTSCPRLSDLRDSGQIEQDADVILFVEWLHRTKPDAHDEGEYRMMIAKNRNRQIKKTIIDCVFEPDRQRLFVKSGPEQGERAYEEGPLGF